MYQTIRCRHIQRRRYFLSMYKIMFGENASIIEQNNIRKT